MYRLWVKYDGTSFFVCDGTHARLNKIAALGNAVFARRGVKHHYYMEEISDADMQAEG